MCVCLKGGGGENNLICVKSLVQTEDEVVDVQTFLTDEVFVFLSMNRLC